MLSQVFSVMGFLESVFSSKTKLFLEYNYLLLAKEEKINRQKWPSEELQLFHAILRYPCLHSGTETFRESGLKWPTPSSSIRANNSSGLPNSAEKNGATASIRECSTVSGTLPRISSSLSSYCSTAKNGRSSPSLWRNPGANTWSKTGFNHLQETSNPKTKDTLQIKC